MIKEALFRGLSIHRRQFFLIFFLIFNSITWFFTILFSIVWEEPYLWLLPAATVVSFLIGPLIAKRVSRMRFLLLWVLLGVISSLFSAVLPEFGEHGVAILLVLWGFSFGIGFPSCLALIPTLTRVEERGRVGGVIFFLTYALLPLFILTIGDLDISSSSLPLAVWRGLGLLLFFLKVDFGAPPKPVSYSSFVPGRRFLLYFIPWLIFCLINYLEQPILEQSLGTDFLETLLIVQFLVGSLVCLISGWIMDFKGRKWTILIGFVALGLGYAALSLSPSLSVAQGFLIVVDSIAWGIFTVAFSFVIWGDIANNRRAEKFYGLGIAPYILAIGLAIFATPSLEVLDLGKALPLASFFLFLAVIPIFFAPETLPEKVLKEREIKKYVEEAKKVAGRP